MPQCYLLGISAGSSLDQQSNNVSLFNLVEQVNVPPGAPPPPNNLLPLELHAYFRLAPDELGSTLEMRFALVADTGLETLSEVVRHTCATPRYRTRTLGTNARFFFEGLYAGHNGRENKGLFSVGRCKEKGRF